MGYRRPQVVVAALGLVLFGALLSVSIAGGQTAQEQPEADNTITRIEVFQNASARWSLQVRTRLETPEEEDRYRRFQERLRNNESAFVDRFKSRMTRVVAAAANATGRNMAADGFAVTTHIQELPRTWGIVRYEFVWRNFAVIENKSLVVGDVFEGGFFLAEGDRLVVEAPTGYHLAESIPQPGTSANGAVGWEGRRDFEDRHPRVRFDPNRTTATTSVPAHSPSNETERSNPFPLAGYLPPNIGWPAIALAVLLLLSGLFLVLHRVRVNGGFAAAGDAQSDELMTDTERIRQLLEANGGRVSQADLDEALEWSSSKTSRVLSEMAEAGTVEKLRIGRENVIQLQETDEQE